MIGLWRGPGSSSDGVWFAVSGEGGSSDTSTTTLPDFAALSGQIQYSALSGVFKSGTASNSRGNGNSYYWAKFPGGQTAPIVQGQTGGLAIGTVGLGWREVVISREDNTVSWSIDGLKIATITDATFPGDNIFVGYWDFFASVAANPALSFGLVDNLRVEVPVLPAISLNIELINNSAVLSWSNPSFNLQTAPTAAGVYTNVPGATSPFTNTSTAPQEFFRLKAN